MLLKQLIVINNIQMNRYTLKTLRILFKEYAYFATKNPFIANYMSKKANNRIKAVLAEKGRTNNWLAETLGKNRTTVSKWCTNQMQPTVETLYEIAEALEVDVRDLLVSTM